jgi:hypothetical protein
MWRQAAGWRLLPEPGHGERPLPHAWAAPAQGRPPQRAWSGPAKRTGSMDTIRHMPKPRGHERERICASCETFSGTSRLTSDPGHRAPATSPRSHPRPPTDDPASTARAVPSSANAPDAPATSMPPPEPATRPKRTPDATSTATSASRSRSPESRRTSVCIPTKRDRRRKIAWRAQILDQQGIQG